MTDKWKSIRLNERNSGIIARASNFGSESFTDAGREVLADGLKYIMCFHSDYPINRAFMDALKPEGIFDLYEQFEDAIASDNGRVIEGLYRFELTPEGSEFFDPNADSYMILHQKEIMDSDGEIYYKRPKH